MTTYYIDFDANKELKARYVDDIHGDQIPETAVEVDEVAFNLTINAPDKVWVLGADGEIVAHERVITLDQRKLVKTQEINSGFALDLLNGFAVSLGFKMDSTLEALQKLKTAYDFAKLVGDTTMAVVDFDDDVHANTSLADVEKILKEVGGNYRSLYMLKQQLRGQVKAAVTAEAVNAIAWAT